MTGFVFKIQANMDPNHRDRIAFMRVCSGKLTRGMKAKLVRTGKTIRAQRAAILLRARPLDRRRGLCRRCRRHSQSRHVAHRRHADRGRGAGRSAACRASRRKSCAAFAISDAMKAKKLREALQQLAEEGVVQLFTPHDGSGAIVGVVGALQLDVLATRLDAEYGLTTRYEQSRFSVCRWMTSNDPAKLEKLHRLAWLSHRGRPRRRAGLHVVDRAFQLQLRRRAQSGLSCSRM